MVRKKQNENGLKKIFSSKIFLISIIGVLVFLGIQLGRESYRKYQLQQEINNLKSEISKIEGENQELSNLMEYFKKDSYLEKQARVKLNLKKPGEEAVVFPERKEEAESNASVDVSSADEKKQDKKSTANYWQWWEYFFE
jgi:cell division protein FtsB